MSKMGPCERITLKKEKKTYYWTPGEEGPLREAPIYPRGLK
jgi:hypothetical protein